MASRTSLQTSRADPRGATGIRDIPRDDGPGEGVPMNEPKGPGREVIAARQLVEEWSRKVVDKKLRTYDSPREAYVAFAEWLYARVTPVQGPYGNAFEMEVFRKILPRFDVFQMLLNYQIKKEEAGA